jgi:O-antigen/teichoic acid export membrane protein
MVEEPSQVRPNYHRPGTGVVSFTGLHQLMTQRFARNTAYSTAAGLIMSVGRFATTIAMARVLGVEATGVAAFALWLISLVCAVTSLGVYSTLTRYLPELKSDEDARKLTRLLLLPYGGVALLAAAMFAACYATDFLGLASRTAGVIGTANVTVVIVLYVIQSLATFGLGYLVGQQQFRNFAAVSLVSNLLQVSLVIVAGLKWGVNGVLFGFIVGGLPFALLCLRLGVGRLALPVQLKNRLFRFTVFSWASTLANELVWARLEMAFLGHFWGSGAVGLYSVGFTLASLATQGPLLLTGGLLPYFAEAISGNRMDRAKIRLQTAMRLVAFFVLPMCFGMAALIPELLPLLYGNSFAAGSTAAMILVSSAGLGANVVVPLAFINGMERSDFLFAVNITGAVLSLALGLVLVASLGIVGAALARASVLIFVLAASLWFLRYRLGCRPPLAQLGLLFLSALASACVAALVASQVPGLLGFLISIPAAALVYVLFVRVLSAIPDEDIESLQGLFAHGPVPLQRGTGLALRVLLGNRSQ